MALTTRSRELQVVARYSPLTLCLLAVASGNGLVTDAEAEACAEFLWGFEFTSTPAAYSDASQLRFYNCVEALRSRGSAGGRQLLAGVHYPTFLRSLDASSDFPVSLRRWQELQRCTQLEPGFGRSMECCQGITTPLAPPGGQPAPGAAGCWAGDAELAAACCRALQGAAAGGASDPGQLLVLTPAYDVNVGSRMRQQGTFHVGQSYALQSLCGPGDTVVDAGANLGGFTLPLALQVGAQGRVHAFEPFRRVFQLLTANVALNGLGNVVTHNVALGGRAERLHLRQPDLTRFNLPSSMQVRTQGYSESAESGRKWTLFYEEGPGEDVEIRRLDDFDFPSLRLLKIDVEDMETEVVEGARRTIELHRPTVWAENARLFERGDRSFVDAMARLGYDCAAVNGLEWELLCVPHGSKPVELVMP